MALGYPSGPCVALGSRTRMEGSTRVGPEPRTEPAPRNGTHLSAEAGQPTPWATRGLGPGGPRRKAPPPPPSGPPADPRLAPRSPGPAPAPGARPRRGGQPRAGPRRSRAPRRPAANPSVAEYRRVGGGPRPRCGGPGTADARGPAPERRRPLGAGRGHGGGPGRRRAAAWAQPAAGAPANSARRRHALEGAPPDRGDPVARRAEGPVDDGPSHARRAARQPQAPRRPRVGATRRARVRAPAGPSAAGRDDARARGQRVEAREETVVAVAPRRRHTPVPPPAHADGDWAPPVPAPGLLFTAHQTRRPEEPEERTHHPSRGESEPLAYPERWRSGGRSPDCAVRPLGGPVRVHDGCPSRVPVPSGKSGRSVWTGKTRNGQRETGGSVGLGSESVPFWGRGRWGTSNRLEPHFSFDK